MFQNDCYTKGGVWYCNQYPGARCDIWSALYQYSFYQNPNWTSAMAPAAEIHKYIKVSASSFHMSRNEFETCDHRMRLRGSGSLTGSVSTRGSSRQCGTRLLQNGSSGRDKFVPILNCINGLKLIRLLKSNVSHLAHRLESRKSRESAPEEEVIRDQIQSCQAYPGKGLG